MICMWVWYSFLKMYQLSSNYWKDVSIIFFSTKLLTLLTVIDIYNDLQNYVLIFMSKFSDKNHELS